MRVTEKGQVTIPKHLRDELGIGSGTEVEFQRDDQSIIIRKLDNGDTRGSRMVGRLRGRGDVQLTTEQIMALTREP